MKEDKIIYFEKPGPKNTSEVLKFAATRAKELNAKKIVVASSTGRTALAAKQAFDSEAQINAVTLVTGFSEPNDQWLDNDTRSELESQDIKVLTCQHAFAGVGRAARRKFNTYQLEEMIANCLRIFGHGTKVAIEISLMAADAGLVRTDEDIIAIGGSGKGADTALLLQPANSFDFFDIKIKEIICKPKNI